MFPFRVFPRIYLAMAFVIGVVIFGSVGYVLVEGYSWVEALYMTVITVSTVGFGEVRELSDNGMVFTTVLIMGSLGTFAYSSQRSRRTLSMENTETLSKRHD